MSSSAAPATTAPSEDFADTYELAGTCGYVPLANRDWRPSFEAARRHLGEGASFLDIGCGVGTKVLRAQRAGLNAWGLEIRARNANIASRLGVSVIHGDARIVRAGYAFFDCVFLNHPLTDQEAEERLERQVMEAMRPGALLILYGLLTPFWEEVGPRVFRKP